jgi:hypothetical protein
MNKVAITLVGVLAGFGLASMTEAVEDKQQVRTVRGQVQMKPGGELEEVVAETETGLLESSLTMRELWCA